MEIEFNKSLLCTKERSGISPIDLAALAEMLVAKTQVATEVSMYLFDNPLYE